MGHRFGRSLSMALAACIAGALTLVPCQSTEAAMLPPGGAVAPTGFPPPVGVLLATTGAVPFVALDAVSFAGTLKTDVYTGDALNPFGPTALTFAWTLTNVGPDWLERLTVTNFAGFAVDVGAAPPLGVVPPTVTRSVAGNVIGWDFSPGGLGVPPGGTTAVLLAHVDATLYAPGVANVINGSVAVVPSFQPVVPEPATLSMLALASLGLLARSRR